jgi:hypothetical protein
LKLRRLVVLPVPLSPITMIAVLIVVSCVVCVEELVPLLDGLIELVV